MRALSAWLYLPIVICVLLLGQLSFAEETVYKARLQPGQKCNAPEGSPATCSDDISTGYLSNSQPVVGSLTSTNIVCVQNARAFNLTACISAMNAALGTNSFTVYRKDEIDGKTDAISSQLSDLGTKVDSLNKRMADDEAGLPGQIDQFAVQKLLETIKTLEARVQALEKQVNARQ